MFNIQKYISDAANEIKNKVSSVGQNIAPSVGGFINQAKASLAKTAPIAQLQNRLAVLDTIRNRAGEMATSTIKNSIQTNPTLTGFSNYVSGIQKDPTKLKRDIVSEIASVNTKLPFGFSIPTSTQDFESRFGITPESKLAKQARMEKIRKYGFGSLTKEEQQAEIEPMLNIAMMTSGPEFKGSGLLKEGEGVVKNVLTKMRGSESPLSGLLTESPAQTAMRRAAKLAPQDIYSGTLDALRTAKGKLGINTNAVADSFDGFMKSSATNVKDKVNIFDYLRTPDRVLTKIGLGKQAEQLRTAWSSYLDQLPKQIDKISAWAKEVPSADSNQKIFKFLDGQIPDKNLLPNELKVGNEIKSYLKGWAEKLGLPEDKRITNYITHIWEKGTISQEFPEDIASLIRDKVAGSVYDPFVQKRMGQAGYIEDTWKALDAYTKRALRKVSLDPVLEQVKTAANSLEDSQYKYVKTYIDRVNMRPSDVDNLIDNAFKSVFGYKFGPRPTATITQTARRAVYRGLLGLNPASALKNLSQGANTYAELGEKYTVLGYAKVAQNLPKFLMGADTELNTVGVLRDGFVQDRQLAVTKQLLQKMDDGLFYQFNLAEKINRGAAYFGAKAKFLKEGLTESEAIKKAVDVVRKTQFTFGSVDTPVALQSDLAKTLAQFQSYSLKQFEFLGEKIATKDIAGIVRYIGANLLFAATIGKLIGFDFKDMIPSFRIGAPPTMTLPIGVAESIPQDQQNPDKNFLQRLVTNPDVQKGAMNYIPAGGQIRKTYQGINYVNQGGSYTSSGNLQYPFVGNPVNAALFGKYNNDQANNYFNNPQPLGATQTQIYKALVESGMNPQEAYNQMTTQRTSNAKLDSFLKGQQPSIVDKVKGLFTPTVQQPTQNIDPLFKAVQDQYKTNSDMALITSIFQKTNNPTQAEQAMKAVGLNISYEDAMAHVVKNLNVENRASYLQASFSKMDSQTFKDTLNKFIDGSIVTNSVIDQWEKSGAVSSARAKTLKDYIKVRSGKKVSGGSRKPKAISIGKIKTPSTKKVALPKVYQPVKLKTK